MIFLIIAVGYGITKTGMFSAKARTDVTNIVMYVVLPANIFSAFDVELTTDLLRQSGLVFIFAFGLQGLYMILNQVLYRRFPQGQRAVLKYATIGNNAGFMGLPIMGEIFGPIGMLYGSIMIIPMRIFMWTVGLALFISGETKGAEKTKRNMMTLIVHPCTWAVILGFGYMFAPFSLPAFLSNAIRTVGDTVTVLSMLVVGSLLTGMNLKSALDKGCFYYSFFRLLAIPAVAFIVLHLLEVDPVAKGVIVLTTAMPAAIATAMLAEKYNADSAFASKVIFVSTALSIITLPIMSEVLTRVS